MVDHSKPTPPPLPDWVTNPDSGANTENTGNSESTNADFEDSNTDSGENGGSTASDTTIE